MGPKLSRHIPRLVLLVLDMLLLWLKICNPRLFADDCLLFRPIRNNRDTQILQNDLNSMEEWENRWCLVALQIAHQRWSIYGPLVVLLAFDGLGSLGSIKRCYNQYEIMGYTDSAERPQLTGRMGE
jgi:hypothetical protein